MTGAGQRVSEAKEAQGSARRLMLTLPEGPTMCIWRLIVTAEGMAAVNDRLSGLQQLKQENRQLKEQAIRKAAFDKKTKIDLGLDGLALLGKRGIDLFRSRISEAVQQKKLEIEKQKSIEREKSRGRGQGFSR